MGKIKISSAIQRIIYYWRRYMGRRVKGGKVYSFDDVYILEKRIGAYFKNPNKFNFDKPQMGIDNFGYQEVPKEAKDVKPHN